jgi:uncharacterized protein with PIN domain
MDCKKCGKPIVLVPSAAERAKKDMGGNSAAYYTNLFTVCNECTIASWYGRPIVPYKKPKNWLTF